MKNSKQKNGCASRDDDDMTPFSSHSFPRRNEDDDDFLTFYFFKYGTYLKIVYLAGAGFFFGFNTANKIRPPTKA